MFFMVNAVSSAVTFEAMEYLDNDYVQHVHDGLSVLLHLWERLSLSSS